MLKGYVQDGSMEIKRTLRQKIMTRLFPTNTTDLFPNNIGPEQGWISTTIDTRLCWRDRLRLLFSGWCRVEVVTVTSKKVSGKSESKFFVLPGKPLLNGNPR